MEPRAISPSAVAIASKRKMRRRRHRKVKTQEEESTESKVEKLKLWQEEIYWEIEEERHRFLYKLEPLIWKWKRQLPNLRDFFRPEEIDLLLLDALTLLDEDPNGDFIDFVIRTGYKNKPDIGKDGKPRALLRRTTALHLAVRRGWWISIIDDLFKIYSSFDVNYVDEYGFTHFHVACMYGYNNIVKRFLDLGQDPNCPVNESDRVTNSPLHFAACYQRKQVVELLLRRGANPSSVGVKGCTPLHIICWITYDADMAKMLLELGHEKYKPVLIDARDELGRTPLQWAVANILPDVVHLLLDHGADMSSFVFPGYFGERYRKNDYLIGRKLEVASDALSIVECLEEKGYELNLKEALWIMLFFTNVAWPGRFWRYVHVLFSKRRGRLWADDELPMEPLCSENKSEMVSRGFCQRWTLEFFLTLTDYRLPILCCEKIIKQLSKNDLLMMCFAAYRKSQRNEAHDKTKEVEKLQNLHLSE